LLQPLEKWGKMTSDRAFVRPKIGFVLPQWDEQHSGPLEPTALRWSEL
jgi:hypothetical protein